MQEVYNFSAGPAMLPKSVLKKAQQQMLNYNQTGQSVMEMSHRSKEFEHIINETEVILREVMQIPKDYKVLFLQGGASSQFSMIPLNLMNKSKKADFVLTGQWATKAYKEASRYGITNIVASSRDENFSYIPKLDKDNFTKDADYFYICLNNTIYGTMYNELPKTGKVPLVADASSYILSQPIDISNFGLVYACTQKNMGMAGLTVVIIRQDLIDNSMEITPTMFKYKVHDDAHSLYNTPPCYAIYISKLILEWIKDEVGGLKNVKQLNESKVNILYEYLDKSSMFKGTARKEDRSLMNVPFITGDKELDKKFIKEASEHGLLNIKGHRSIGGMRASIYNAMPIAGVEKLVDFMSKFENSN